MTAPRSAPRAQRWVPAALRGHAWVLLSASGFPMLLGGVVHLGTGRPEAAGLQFVGGNLGLTWEELVARDPATATAISGFVRVLGLFGLVAFALFTTMVATAYRRGERWAWSVAWVYPVAIVGFAWIGGVHRGWTGGEGSWALPGTVGVLVVILTGLLLPFRQFFPRAAPTPS